MRIAILANQTSWYARDLDRAIAAAGNEPLLLDFRTLRSDITSDGVQIAASDYDGNSVSLDDCDAVIVRTMPPGSLEQVVFRMDALGQLASLGVMVVNSPRSIECAVDKYLTTAKLAAAGLPIPRTVACETVDQSMDAFRAMDNDVVLKPLFGSEGRGIVRLSDEETAFRVFKSLRMTDAVFYLQQFVAHAGFDVRVLVLDREPIAAMKRRNDLDFRTNVNQQGKAEPHSPTEEEVNLAVCAAAATGTRIAGVDILRDEHGCPFVLEVNAVPGWKALARVTGVDVAAALVQSIENEKQSHEC